MPRKYLKSVLPQAEKIRRIPGVSWVTHWLGDEHLWHINRRSISLGVGIGLFFAFWPVPVQTLLAIGVAILLRANLPVSVVCVWVSNPLTFVPIFGSAYYFGSWLLGLEQVENFDGNIANLGRDVGVLWVGCLALGTLSAGLGWLTMRTYWHWHVQSSWHERRRSRSQRKRPKNCPPRSGG